MLTLERPNRPQQSSVIIDRLLLEETQGVSKKDKFVLFCLKKIYLASRVASILILRKKNGDLPYTEDGTSFKNFLYKSVKSLGMANLQLKVNLPRYGFQVYCRNEDDFNDFVIIAQHELNLLRHFSPKEGDVVVDISTGLCTMISSKQVGANGKVIAIIDDPQNYDTLNHTIKSNNLANVMSFNYVACSKEMQMVLIPYRRMLLNKDKKPTTVVTTKAVYANTLDNLLQKNGINKVNWVKIGTQGKEFEVLKGAHNLLSNSEDIALLIEVHGHDNNYKPLIEFLKSYNFVIVFEQNYEQGNKHIITKKSSSSR
jgi:FkbM family methyltransferase